jgi:hypothetical protein
MSSSKFFLCLLVSLSIATGGAPSAGAQSTSPGVEYFGPHAWTNWDAGMIKAQGFGVPSADSQSAAQALLMARRAAIVDGYRNLLEASIDVAVRSRTAVEQGGVKWDTIETQIEGVVRGAGILEEQQYPDGRYAVVLAMPLYGPNGLGQTVMPHMMPPGPPVAIPAPAPSEPSLMPPPPAPSAPRLAPIHPRYTPLPLPHNSGGAYTGLIVVVQGAHLDRSMSPAIVTPEGTVVYGRGWWRPGEISQELANAVGIVGYSPAPGTDSRAGSNPLVVYAIGISGPPESNFKTDVVISDEDAAKIRDADAAGGFLEQLKVDIVVGP